MRKIRFAAALVATLLPAAWVGAAGGGGGGGGGGGTEAEQVKADPQYTEAVLAIKAQNYGRALQLLQAYAQRVPADADVENWLGYAYRKTGQLDPAFRHYHAALKLNPKHRGAHEYIGEAYLMAGDLAKAEEHLKTLDKLCFLPCEEYTDLKKAVAEYKAKRAAAR